jgi:predicted DsbA family dithiol-disulfide isomerase
MEQPAWVEFFFDPICPWAYQTSLWMRDVRDRTDLDVRWRFFSLEEINRVEGKKHPWERPWSYGWSLMRVGALLRREEPALLDRWYAATGEALFEQGEPVFLQEGAERVAAEAGLPADVVARALADETTHDDVRSDHDHVVSTYAGYGVPTLVFPTGQAIFGPVVVPAPRGDDSLALWDVVRGWLQFPHLYEMRTPKRRADHEHIAAAFEPYLRARKWQTIQNPVE